MEGYVPSFVVFVLSLVKMCELVSVILVADFSTGQTDRRK